MSDPWGSTKKTNTPANTSVNDIFGGLGSYRDIQRHRMSAQSSTVARILEGFRVTFEKVVRIMSNGRPITVRFSSSPPVPGVAGWTDGEDIWLHAPLMVKAILPMVDSSGAVVREGNLAEVVASQEGIMYHELSHCLYTPRYNDYLLSTIAVEEQRHRNSNGWNTYLFKAFGILEDQRIERLFISRYSSIAKYFELMVMRWVLGLDGDGSDDSEVVPNAESYKLAYLGLGGRKYLDPVFVDKFRKLFAKPNLLPEIDRLVEEYCSLPLSSVDNQRKAYLIVVKVAKIIHELAPPLNAQLTNSSHGASDVGDNNSGYNSTQADMAPTFNKGEIDQVDTKDAEQEGSAGDSPSIETGDSGNDSGNASASGSGDEGTQDSDSSSGNNAGDDSASLNAHQSGQVKRSIQAIAGKTVDDLLHGGGDSSPLRHEVNEHTELSIKYAETKAPSPFEYSEFYEYKIDGPMRQTVTSCINGFRKLRSELDSAWDGPHSSGRVNVSYAMQAEHDPSNVDVFDSWHESQLEKAGVEIVLCVDLSGSMGAGRGSEKDMASQMVWSIKRTIDQLGEDCTVLGFASNTTLLYAKREKVRKDKYRMYTDSGGTQAYLAIKEAARLLRNSTKPNKAMVILTDGMWDDLVECDNIIADMNKDPSLVTALFGISRAVTLHGKHNCKVAMDIGTPQHVVEFVRAMIASFMANANRR